MKPHKLVCQCCKTHSAIKVVGGRLDDHMKTTGFTPVMNVRNGLEVMWVCPACVIDLTPHVQAIIDKFKDQARYLHFSHLLDMVKK